jgi:hypothetical protein
MTQQQLRLESWFSHRRCRNGKLGRGFHAESAWYCPLQRCFVCDKLGGLKDVRDHGDVYGWSLANPDDWAEIPARDHETLCLSCWMRAKQVMNLRWDARELKRLANKLLKEVRGAKERRPDARGPNGCD